MGRVCVYLPPFAGDYSGVCSALFDLGGMIVIHDANGCTGNYTHFDEPRWYGSNSMVYCSGYRKADAMLGNDEHIIKRIQAAVEKMKPKFIAIVGSPVPNVVGFDFNGVAKSIEKRTGIKTFGFATMGIKGSYKDGIVMATKAFLERFAEKTEEKQEKLINIWGISPLDMDSDNYRHLCQRLRDKGYELRVIGDNYGSLEQIKYPTKAVLSLAWNQAGYELCQLVEKWYGVPYLAGVAIGEEAFERYFQCMEKCIKSRQSEFFKCRDNEKDKLKNDKCQKKAVIIHDAVIGSAIADFLYSKGYQTEVYTVFGKSKGMEEFCDGYLHQEEAIKAKLDEASYDLFAADPVLLDLIEEDRKVDKLVLPIHAISSRVCKKQNWLYTDENKWKI